MNNEPNPQQWEQQKQPLQPPTQYEPQPQWSQPQPQAWEQQPPPAYHQPQAWEQLPANQYAPQQYAQGQYNQYQYSNVPPYAQPQVQSQRADNLLVRFLMMGIAVRIVLLLCL